MPAHEDYDSEDAESPQQTLASRGGAPAHEDFDSEDSEPPPPPPDEDSDSEDGEPAHVEPSLQSAEPAHGTSRRVSFGGPPPIPVGSVPPPLACIPSDATEVMDDESEASLARMPELSDVNVARWQASAMTAAVTDASARTEDMRDTMAGSSAAYWMSGRSDFDLEHFDSSRTEEEPVSPMRKRAESVPAIVYSPLFPEFAEKLTSRRRHTMARLLHPKRCPLPPSMPAPPDGVADGALPRLLDPPPAHMPDPPKGFVKRSSIQPPPVLLIEEETAAIAEESRVPARTSMPRSSNPPLFDGPSLDMELEDPSPPSSPSPGVVANRDLALENSDQGAFKRMPRLSLDSGPDVPQHLSHRLSIRRASIEAAKLLPQMAEEAEVPPQLKWLQQQEAAISAREASEAPDAPEAPPNDETVELRKAAEDAAALRREAEEAAEMAATKAAEATEAAAKAVEQAAALIAAAQSPAALQPTDTDHQAWPPSKELPPPPAYPPPPPNKPANRRASHAYAPGCELLTASSSSLPKHPRRVSAPSALPAWMQSTIADLRTQNAHAFEVQTRLSAQLDAAQQQKLAAEAQACAAREEARAHAARAHEAASNVALRAASGREDAAIRLRTERGELAGQVAAKALGKREDAEMAMATMMAEKNAAERDAETARAALAEMQHASRREAQARTALEAQLHAAVGREAALQETAERDRKAAAAALVAEQQASSQAAAKADRLAAAVKTALRGQGSAMLGHAAADCESPSTINQPGRRVSAPSIASSPATVSGESPARSICSAANLPGALASHDTPSGMSRAAWSGGALMPPQQLESHAESKGAARADLPEDGAPPPPPGGSKVVISTTTTHTQSFYQLGE